jgi:predicted HTH transcriptional regulator
VKTAFKLEGTIRVDYTPVHTALREAIANAVIHADYHGKRGIVIEKSVYSLRIANPGSFRIPLPVATDGGISDPRNTTIFKILSLVGIGERAGSGLNTIQHEWEKHRWPSPTVYQSFNPERTTLVLSWTIDNNSSEKTSESSEKTSESSEKTSKSSEKTSERILQLIMVNNKVSSAELSVAIGISSRAVEKQLKALKDKGVLKRRGPAKGGSWEIVLD